MITLTRSRNRRRFQPSIDALALRIAPTVFLPPPDYVPVGEVSYPDCGDLGEAPDAGPDHSIQLVDVSYPDLGE